MKKRSFNPFLPADVCIADGEPHVFGNRIYLFGSHDRPGGTTFCELDYEFWSAPLDDLSDWSCKGISYSAKQDPLYGENAKYLYAPDVVKGNDGKYYLYYALAGEKGRHGYDGPINVAVCDTPDGKYEYLGCLKNPDGTMFNSCVLFDPAVINDSGTIRLYFGASYLFDEFRLPPFRQIFDRVQSKIFGKSVYEMKKDITGAFTVVLDDDMLTVRTKPVKILPTKTRGTAFDGHAFFEGSSIRKFGDRYYFIYSSRRNHELCYAVSQYPDRDFSYGGTVISNGGIGYQGRKPVWVFLVESIRKMPGATMWPKGGSTMVTVKQVGQAIAGAIERNKGGNCYPIGYYNLTWKELIAICHKYLGTPNKKVITIPDFMYAMAGKKIKADYKKKGIEGGLDMVKFTELQCSNQFINKEQGCVPLGVEPDDIDTAIGDSVKLCVDIIDGKAKNIVAMKGE